MNEMLRRSVGELSIIGMKIERMHIEMDSKIMYRGESIFHQKPIEMIGLWLKGRKFTSSKEILIIYF